MLRTQQDGQCNLCSEYIRERASVNCRDRTEETDIHLPAVLRRFSSPRIRFGPKNNNNNNNTSKIRSIHSVYGQQYTRITITVGRSPAAVWYKHNVPSSSSTPLIKCCNTTNRGSQTRAREKMRSRATNGQLLLPIVRSRRRMNS